MTATYKPLRCTPTYGTPRHRSGIVHRVRRAEEGRMSGRGATWYVATWMCGGRSIDAIFGDEAAASGSACKRCDIASSSAVVYRCYSADNRLLYIGSCIYWPSREGLHRKLAPWWAEVARVDQEPQSNLATARRAEKAAIEAEAPLHNKQYNVQRFRRDGYAYVPVAEAA